ncbi:MAG: hypothetical protein ABI824_01175 [Acidobacteriota bacterium]
MNSIFLKCAVISAALLAPATSFAQVSCTREGLDAATKLFIAAQTKGDTSGMPLAMGVGYYEDMKLIPIDTGLIKKPMKIDFHRSLLDTATCQTFTEYIVTKDPEAYVNGARLRVNHDKIVEIELITTKVGYWLFSADNYMKWSPNEDWGTIPAAKRDTRNTLEAAANAYLDAFLEQKKDMVPWGYPCNRTEGGMRTGTGIATDSCDVGVPAGVNIQGRRFIVDETIGAVQVFCTFGAGGVGGSGAPDSHLFRLIDGKLRMVHTLTHLLQAAGPGRGAGAAKGAPGGPGAAKGGPAPGK